MINRPKYSPGDLVLHKGKIRQVSNVFFASSSAVTGTYYKGWIYSLVPQEPNDWYTPAIEPQLEPVFTL